MTEIRSAVLPGDDISILNPEVDKTDTYFFLTREGGTGVLQIIGSPKDTSVKIRYKLAERSKQAATNAPIHKSTATTAPATPDYMKALAVFHAMIKNPGGDLDETLARRDLPLAQRIVSQVLDQIHAFNTLVQDPSIEFPKSFVEVLTKGLDALKAGDLERAKTILNTHTNEEPLNDQMFARLLALARQQRLARATNPAALAAYAASGLSFGPVIERIVNDLDKNMTNPRLRVGCTTRVRSGKPAPPDDRPRYWRNSPGNVKVTSIHEPMRL